MSHSIRIAAASLVASLAAVAGLVSIAPSATAEEWTKAPDSRPCATGQEFDRLPTDGNRSEVESLIDTKGWVVDLEPFYYQIKHYAACGNPHGWLAALYLFTKDGWKLQRALYIYECRQKVEGAPAGYCDPDVVNLSEALLLWGRHGSERAERRHMTLR